MVSILVVDDDLDIQAMLCDVLIDEGYEVRLASNGREALNQIERERPDLIVLDLMMPVMDGRQFYQHFRTNHPTNAHSRIPVLLVSAGQGLRETAGELGADSYLPKPFDLDAFVLQIERLTR